MKKHIVRRGQADLTFHTIDELLRSVLNARGASADAQSDYRLQNLLHPKKLKGLDDAVGLVCSVLERQQKILIVGDFDADGATSTALAVSCLRAFGCESVDFLVPNRFDFGYGLTPEIVDVAAQNPPDLIITVDNGISSIAGVAHAHANNIKVLVTDHHLPGETLPEADAIVNPNQPGCEFESKNLAGVGVVFYLMSAVRAALRESGWFEERQLAPVNMANYLDLVALGTVADVVPLDYNNRILVAAGLERVRAGKALPGIRALIRIANRRQATLAASDFGFAIGPRLNAAGRLDDMSLGIRTLLTQSESEAMALAQQLDDFNRDRKLIEAGMQQEAESILRDLVSISSEDVPSGICLYKDDWHQGVIGILASRVKDKLHRPTIIFAQSDNGELKGSGRSIPGIHLRDVLDEVATSSPGLLAKFGGHAMAAGLSLAADKLDEFQMLFDRCVAKHLTEELRSPVAFSDGALAPQLFTLEAASAIEQAGPWGQNFPEPRFDGVFQILSQRIVGQKHLKLTLCLEGEAQCVFDAIAFNVDTAVWPANDVNQVRLLFQLDSNEFRGQVNLQLMVDYLEPA